MRALLEVRNLTSHALGIARRHVANLLEVPVVLAALVREAVPVTLRAEDDQTGAGLGKPLGGRAVRLHALVELRLVLLRHKERPSSRLVDERKGPISSPASQ